MKKYNKILMLDLDGIVIVTSNKKDNYMTLFDDDKVKLLEYIIDNTDADIVISSQRRILGLEKLKNMWISRNYPGDVVDITPYSEISRGDDINMWLEQNEVDIYCIIDDLNDDFYPEQYPYFVKCQTKVGLTKELADNVIKILNNDNKF